MPPHGNTVSQELSKRFFHPYIVSEIVSYIDLEDDKTLANLMKVSKAFYHEAGWRLHDILVWGPRQPKSPLIGWTKPDSPWCKASLLCRTTILNVFQHDKKHCFADCRVAHTNGEITIRPLELPRLYRLHIDFDNEKTCNSLDCPITRNLKPVALYLKYPQHAAANALPHGLVSNLKYLYIDLGIGGVSYLSRILAMYIPRGILELEICFMLEDDLDPEDKWTHHDAFRKACKDIIDIVTDPGMTALHIIGIIIGLEGGPEPWDGIKEDDDDDSEYGWDEFWEYSELWDEAMSEWAEEIEDRVFLLARNRR